MAAIEISPKLTAVPNAAGDVERSFIPTLIQTILRIADPSTDAPSAAETPGAKRRATPEAAMQHAKNARAKAASIALGWRTSKPPVPKDVHTNTPNTLPRHSKPATACVRLKNFLADWSFILMPTAKSTMKAGPGCSFFGCSSSPQYVSNNRTADANMRCQGNRCLPTLQWTARNPTFATHCCWPRAARKPSGRS